MPACNHETLTFGSGDYYVTCQQCGVFWAMIGLGRPEYGKDKDGNEIGCAPELSNKGGDYSGERTK